MRMFRKLIVTAASIACLSAASGWADEPLIPSDSLIRPTFSATSDESVLSNVGCDCLPQNDCRRFYLSAMIGPSFASLNDTADPSLNTNGSIFAAGGALGVALERTNGRLRLEVEGMGRTTYLEAIESMPGFSQLTTNNWSVLGNAWRDLMLTDRFGIYGGGGIGAGGYLLGQRNPPPFVPLQYGPAKAAFAWQAGGGLIYEISDNVTFDVGYRFFQLGVMRQDAVVAPNQFQASEVMFTARMYEPFKRWLR